MTKKVELVTSTPDETREQENKEVALTWLDKRDKAIKSKTKKELIEIISRAFHVLDEDDRLEYAEEEIIWCLQNRKLTNGQMYSEIQTISTQMSILFRAIEHLEKAFK